MSSVGQTLPPKCIISSLNSPFEVKQWWLYKEWNCSNPWQAEIRSQFPEISMLSPTLPTPDVTKIEKVFSKIRGNHAIWMDEKENGYWKKVVVTDLTQEWIQNNVKILHSTNEQFDVENLDGIVLWWSNVNKIYELLEGNHRINAWLRTNTPLPLSGTMFFGEPRE